MIKLTRIDGTEFYLNPDLFEVMEASHDTHITLTNGHRYVCQESPETIIERIAEFRRRAIGAVPEERLMDLATVIGLGIALIGIIGGNILEGGNPMKLINLPGFFIVILGSFGAVMISQPLSVMVGLPKTIMKAFFTGGGHNSAATVELFVQMADKARREGLLALEADIEKIHDPFTRKGVQLMIDGTDPELLREIMEIERESMKHRHESNFAALEFMGGIAPTIGVLGAVMGLMTVMSHLDEPDHIGPGIATAFVATFYGVFTANVLWLPLAAKLKSNSKHELHALDVVIEGLMSIQAGDNPRIVREKLEGFLQPSMRGRKDDHGEARREAA